MRNLTGYRLRLRNRRLYHRVRSVSWWWNAHLRGIAVKSFMTRGRFARLCGPIDSKTGPTERQEILARGARTAEATMTHAVMSYEGAVRLISFRGGDPLPWSAMVLARTAFEASLRIIWLLDPTIDDGVLLSRIGATTFENLEEQRKQHAVIPEEFRVTPQAQTDDAREFYKGALEECGCRVVSSNGLRSGYVESPTGERAGFPFEMVAASTRWWSLVGVFTYRWLCSFTHAAFVPPANSPMPVAALDEENTYLVLQLATDSLWKAMDAYSMWVGMPDGIMRRQLSRVAALLESRLPENLRLERPPTPIEGYFMGAVAVMEDLGFVSQGAIRRFSKHYVRRLDVPRRRQRSWRRAAAQRSSAPSGSSEGGGEPV